MKILFVLRHAMYVRNFEALIVELCRRGHHVRIGFVLRIPGVHDGQPERMARSLPGFSYRHLPSRSDGWLIFATAVRNLLNYLRYLHPRYRSAGKLTDRAAAVIPRPLRAVLALPGIRSAAALRILDRGLRLLEAGIPPDPAIARVIAEEAPDLFLVSPLVDTASSEIDYLKNARILGCRTGLCVASWDNLTNKGLIQIPPDYTYVWNEAMKAEAIGLHGIPAERVCVTGAPIFDHWFTQTPQYGRAEFMGRIGLNPAEPYFIYMCSSSFIADKETQFVHRWIRSLRDSGKALARAGVLIRPHPANTLQWQKADFSAHGNAAIWPREGSHPIDDQSKADYFDSIHHSSAVVGINTSAFIESGIIGKPCFTVLDPDFHLTQAGTLHFRHISEGGLLYVSKTLDDHVELLDRVLGGKDTGASDRRNFLREFVRPSGLEIASAGVYADSLIAQGMSKRQTAPPFAPAPILLAVRLLSIPIAAILSLIRRRDPAADHG